MNDQQFKTYLESQALWRREEEQKRSEKEYLNDLVTNLIKSDGGNLDEYRRWSTRIRSNAALLQDNAATVQLMLRTTLGPLKDEIDRYILDFVKLNPGKGRLEVPCGDLLAYLNRSFLPSNDLDYVRETMESLRQLSGETLRVFNRKFRDLSELAYPSKQRSEDQKKLLIRYYIKGLASRDTARTVLKSSPASLHDAMTTAVDNDEVEDALQRLGHRNEEPMDISTIHQQQTSSMNTLSIQLDRMNTKLAKMELQIQQDRPRRPPRRFGKAGSRMDRGKIICYTCNVPGHISKFCPKRSQKAPAEPMETSPVLPTAGMDQENY